MRFVIAFIIVVMLVAAESLFAAQMIVWGLAQFHVHSGILGPWLMTQAIMMLAGTASQASK